MSKLKKSSVFRRFTAFLLAFCCLFSMLPTAMAADGDENLQYRYVWLVSQPGMYLRFEPDGSVWIKDQDPAMNGKEYRLSRTTYEGEDVYMLLDGQGHPSYTDPEEGIGYIGMETLFNKATQPFVPNWPDAEFEYVDGSAQPLDKNAVTEENQGYTYWAGNIQGTSNRCYVYEGPGAWDQCTEDQPSTIKVITFNQEDFSTDPNGVSIYYAQVRFLASDLQPYVDQAVESGQAISTGNGIDFNFGNNSMFLYQSTEPLPDPELDDQGTVIFDFNLPGYPASVDYMEEAGTMVSVPGISTQEVQGVTFIFKGWYDRPEGGTQLTASQVEVPRADYDIYYAQWELYVPDPDIPTVGEGDMYVGYFDYNLEGTGVTSVYCAAGEFTWTVTVDGESETYTATLPFQFPEDPYRTGYRFLGWATTPDATCRPAMITRSMVYGKQSTIP